MREHRLRHPASVALLASLLAGAAACHGASTAHSAAATGAAGPEQSAVGAPSPAVTAKQVDPCAMLSAAQASAVVGVHYASAKATANGMCTYTTTDAPIGMFVIISPGAGTAAWSEQLGTLEEDGGDKPVTLTGVGDRAAGTGTEIGVQADGYIIDVHGGDPDGNGHAFPKSVAVAKALIAALP